MAKKGKKILNQRENQKISEKKSSGLSGAEELEKKLESPMVQLK